MSEQTNEVVQHTGWGGQTTQIGVQNNHLGLTAKDAVQIAMELFREHFPQLVKECVEKVRQQLEAELGKIPPEQIQPPRAKIAVRALQNAVLSEEEELQAMYAKLLASDMNTEQRPNVHPAYVDILNQLSADEARILKFIAAASESPAAEEQLASKWIDGDSPETDLMKHLAGALITDIANKAGCNHSQNIELLFENLERLSLIRLSPTTRQSPTPRATIRAASSMANMHRTVGTAYVDLPFSTPERPRFLERMRVILTTYGQAFCDVCIPKE